MKISNFLKEYKEIIAFTAIGVIFGYFLLSPFAMVVSDMIHSNLPAGKVHSMYSNPWKSIFEVFKSYLFIWSSIFAVFSGIPGVFIGLYFKARRKYLDKLNDSYKRLCELERLKDSLVHMIVHDLNNPLTAVSGNLQLLQMGSDGMLTDDQKEVIKQGLFSTNELKTMINNLLDINKMEEGKLTLKYENFNLSGLLQEVVNEMKIIAEKDGKKLSLEIAGNMPEVKADKELIRRVIANLVTNAIKHTPSDGGASVKTSYGDEDKKFYVQVVDTGEGIPKKYLTKIFEKFVQLEDKETRGGHGLGLTFCKMAVEAHGGKIWVESEPNKRSTFYFTIPAKE